MPILSTHCVRETFSTSLQLAPVTENEVERLGRSVPEYVHREEVIEVDFTMQHLPGSVRSPERMLKCSWRPEEAGRRVRESFYVETGQEQGARPIPRVFVAGRGDVREPIQATGAHGVN